MCIALYHALFGTNFGSKNSPQVRNQSRLIATRHKTICKKMRGKLIRIGRPRRMVRSECEKKEMRGKNQGLALRIEMEPSFATGSLTFLNNRIICYTIPFPSRKGGELKIKKVHKIKICSNSTLARNLVHVLSSLRCALQHTILLPPPSSLAVIFHGE